MNAEVMQTPQLTTSRLLLLGASSVILCMSIIMAVFAPFPLALAIILYGRMKGYLVGIAGLGIIMMFALAVYGNVALFIFSFCVFLFGMGIAEIVKRGIPPIKGMLVFGLAFVGIMTASFGYLMKSQDFSPREYMIEYLEKNRDDIAKRKKEIEQSTDRNSIEILPGLDRPDIPIRELVDSLPSYFFTGVFVALWFNMFLVLKGRRLLFSGHDYPFSEKNLLNFKVPFGFVYLLTVGLVLAVWGNDLRFGSFESVEIVGLFIVQCLGIFYFFQGFGVFSDLLNFLGIVGFFRTLIVVITLFMANYLIAAAGLFDNWFDFRKYFVQQKNKD